MKVSKWLVALSGMLAFLAAECAIAQTATSAAHPNSQQEKMTACNADANAKGLKGEDRQSFMKTCLSHGGTAAKGNSQQEKMKTCNAEANTKGLKGEARQSFMKSCLSGSG